MGTDFSRRTFLTGLGAGATVGAAAVSGMAKPPQAHAIGLERQPEEEPKPPLQEAVVPFDGAHQAGIRTHAQSHLWMIAFNAKSGVGLEEFRRLFRVWTTDARKMTAGEAPMTDLEPEMYFAPANLTITVGLGPRFFELIDREDEKPEWLEQLPEYPGDEIEDRWSGGDICLQVCSDDQLMLSHASRYLIRNAATYLDLAWIQEGFRNAYGSAERDRTTRNRFGQIDGTINPRTDEDFEDQIWIAEGPDWLRGGSALVVRRIKMDIENWDMLDRPSREEVIGRRLDNGAPLGQENEHDPVDLEATDEYGLPYIDRNSHMALAMPPREFPHQRLLRRVYNYDLPPEPGSDSLVNTGLIFACYQKDPLKHFDPIQRRLAESDRLNEWITHVGSAVFVIPRGTNENEYWAQDLLED